MDLGVQKLFSHNAIFPSRYVRLCYEVERRKDELLLYSLSCIHHINQWKPKCTVRKPRGRKVLEGDINWEKKIEKFFFFPIKRSELDI